MLLSLWALVGIALRFPHRPQARSAGSAVASKPGSIPASAEDQREELATRLLDATRGAATVFAYHASFEKGRLAELAVAFPSLADALLDLSGRTVDLLPIVRDHVYHPEFHGSFSLKSVVPALLPHLAHDDLEIASGDDASSVLERLVLEPGSVAPEEREGLCRALRAYCERDTLALVELLRWLSGAA